MTIRVFGRSLDCVPNHSLQKLSLQAASRHRLIAFDPEGSPLLIVACELKSRLGEM